MSDLLLLVSFPLWIIFGAGVLAYLDANEEYYNWYKECPSKVVSLLVLIFWPVLAYFIYKLESKDE